MGRPLSKKYMGNRNIGSSSTTADNGIGGEGVASAAVSGGSYTTRPTFTFTAPTIPGGVTATATITSRAKTATVGGPITIAYLNGEVVSSIGGTTWTVTKEAEQSVTIASTNNGGPGGTARIVLTGAITAVKGANFLTANNISGCGLSVSTQYYILDGGTGTTFTITDSYAKAVAGTPITLGSTGAATNGGVGIGSVYAPVASVTVTNKGNFPYADGALVTSAQATTSTTGSGAGLTIAINAYEAKTTVITEAGSGYVSAPTAATGPTQSVTLGAVTLTTDSGAVGSDTNEENAILAYAYIGGALRLVDLVKQISTKRYKVRYNGTNYTARIRYDAIADGTAGYTAAEGVELNMIASDGTGTYLVRKLYNRTCTLKSLAINNSTIGITSNTAGLVFADNKQTKWTFGSATADTVQIQNA